MIRTEFEFIVEAGGRRINNRDRARVRRLVAQLPLDLDGPGQVTAATEIAASVWDEGQHPIRLLQLVLDSINRKFRHATDRCHT
jgi:hypothetical protein